MYIHIYVFTYIHLYIYTYVHIYIYAYICIVYPERLEQQISDVILWLAAVSKHGCIHPSQSDMKTPQPEIR